MRYCCKKKHTDSKTCITILKSMEIESANMNTAVELVQNVVFLTDTVSECIFCMKAIEKQLASLDHRHGCCTN